MKTITPPERPEYGELIYSMVVGKSGVAWFIPTITNAADEIKCTDSADWNKRGEGYGGSTLYLKLVTNESPFPLHGGWHSNGNALFEDTGMDIRNLHFTYGAIAEEIISTYPDVVLDKIIYQSKRWVLGDFDWLQEMAKDKARKLGKRVYLAKWSMGGGSFQWIYPED